MRAIVCGDAAGGWIVDIHDGENFGVYSPDAPDATNALVKAREMHEAQFPGAANDPMPGARPESVSGGMPEPANDTAPAEPVV